MLVRTQEAQEPASQAWDGHIHPCLAAGRHHTSIRDAWVLEKNSLQAEEQIEEQSLLIAMSPVT